MGSRETSVVRTKCSFSGGNYEYVQEVCMLIDQGMEDSKHTAENGGRKGSFGRLN